MVKWFRKAKPVVNSAQNIPPQGDRVGIIVNIDDEARAYYAMARETWSELPMEFRASAFEQRALRAQQLRRELLLVEAEMQAILDAE